MGLLGEWRDYDQTRLQESNRCKGTVELLLALGAIAISLCQFLYT